MVMMMIQQNRYSPFLFGFFFLLAPCFHLQFCRGAAATNPFLDKPKVKWTYRLPGSGTLTGRGLRNGNEVLSSPDGTMLFVTADDGSLHIIRINSLRDSAVYEPARVPGTYTECRSGVSIVFNQQQQVDFVLYAVIDIPIKAGVLYDGMTYDPSRTTTLSRVLAVNLDGTLRFSVPLNGAVVGKPIVGGSNNSDKVYVVHNSPSYSNAPSLSSSIRGKISVIRMRSNPPTVTASLSPFMEHGPFGPPTGTTVIVKGKLMDVVVVAEAWGDGYSDNQGKVFLLRPSALYEEFNGQGNDSYELKLLSDLGVASVAKPTLKADGKEIFVGASGAKLGGWTSKGDLWSAVSSDQTNVNPSWDVELEQNKANASQPLLVAPILSSDETLLYQVGASTQMYCIDAQTGDIQWNSDGAAWGMRGGILAEPRLAEISQEQPKVYVIESLKGRIRQHNALTGDIDWAIDCNAVSGIPCNDAVEADFSVSPSGTMVYYGDIFGKIVALEVADFTSITPSPTPPPTPRPTEKPIQSVQEEEEIEDPEPPEDLSMTEWMSSPVGERTPAPTASPDAVVVPAAPAPAPLPVPEPNIDSVPFQQEGTDAPTREYDDDGDGGIVEPNTVSVVDPTVAGDSSESEFSSSAAINGNEGDTDSFFSNEIMIILVAVCGGLALAIIVILIAQKARAMKNNKTTPPDDHMLASPEDDGKDWNNAQDEYEEECRRDEEETLREIVGMAAKTPTKGPTKKKQKKMSPMTPSTLASIEESPAENELSFVSDATPDAPIPKKNLEKSFAASLAEEKSLEVTLNDARAQKDSNTPLGSRVTESSSTLRVISLASGQENNADVRLDSTGPPQLSSVEVVAKTDIAGSKPQQQPVRRTFSDPRSDHPVDSAANDLVSVDGSLYLDDDSKFDVASLAQYSVASTTDGAASAELGAHYSGDYGIHYESASPSDQYMKPPRVASPLMGRPLSPEVANYLRRNQASMSPNPMTPKHIEEDPTSPMSTSPVTPPTVDSAYEREVVRKGQSVRPGETDKQGRNRSPSPPPPPVTTEQEEEQPEDAWNSFLSELAKAEREFFNPSFNKKAKEERAQSPPPPPPPPGDPPATKAAPPPPPPPRHRTKLV